MTPRLKNYLEKWRKEVDAALDRHLPRETDFPKTINKAMRYSIFAGGKRLRPVLVVAGAEICGLSGKKVLPTACAMELIHTYSLVHDDLPAMDDDDLRRGRPTSHKVFGEGMAILAGDSLLTYAFDLIAKNAKIVDSRARLDGVLHAVAEGAGYDGMVGGQVQDLEMDGGAWMKLSKARQKEVLDTIHRKKTAALIECSLAAGAHLAGAPKDRVERLVRYGRKIGLAFQIADDVLDIEGDKKLLGKKGSDAENKKLTYPALYGIERSKQMGRQLISEAKQALRPFGARAAVLEDLADYIIERTY
jgi:geranylgeranyl diphosphate synthase type II